MRQCLRWRMSECLAPYLEEIGHGVIAQKGEFGQVNLLEKIVDFNAESSRL